ncbi:MAG TPA: tetratricopeptide repeat protein [Bryobacteraceae bacterium]|nr:tetratricopeptide repeat protein [Bryobacteraceae bacterium]
MTERRVYRILPFTVALLTLLAFLPALQNGFVDWDDPKNIVNNESFRGLGWDQIHWMWTSHLNGHYIPITWMTLGLDYTIWGMDPLGYHLTNILLHAANAVLFYFLAIALFRKAVPQSSPQMRARIPLGALFAALIFAVHPLRAESVAWVTERRDVVSGLFYLAAILVYVRGVQDTPGKPIQRKYYWACLAIFALGILAKEMLVTLPAVLLILDFYPLGRPPSKIWLGKIPFFLISIADGILSLYIVHGEKMTVSLSVVDWFARLAISTYGLAFYLWKTLLPFHLSPFYAITQHRVDPRGLPFLISLLVVILLAALSFLFRRRIPALPAVTLAYGITLIPVLGIFQNGSQIAADRYSYLACLGWALLAGALLIRWRAIAIPLLAAVAVCALVFMTWRQVQVWRDPEALWTQAAAADPSYMAYDNLGLVLSSRGDTAGAIEQYRASIRMFPNYADAHNNLAGSLMSLSQWDDAAREFQIALNLDPNLARAHAGLGYVLMKQSKFGDAIAHFQKALEIDPSLGPVRNYLQQALTQQKSGARSTQ